LDPAPGPRSRRLPLNRRITADELTSAIRGSSSVYDAAKRIGVRNSAIYVALRRYNLEKPKQWHKLWLLRVGRLRKLGLQSIIEQVNDRMYVADLMGTEGTITCGYDATVNKTRLKIQVGMTDRPWVAKFAQVCGVGRPSKLPPKFGRKKDVFVSQLSGLRALLVLRDVFPFLMGGKRREALRAIEFFSPTGYKRGRYRAREIWNPRIFLWKDTGRSRHQNS